MTLAVIALVAAIALICINNDNKEIDNAENVSYIYLYEQDAEFEEALKEENISDVEVVLPTLRHESGSQF